MRFLCIFLLLLLVFSNTFPIVIITYKEVDEATGVEVDFNLRSNKVGDIKDIGQDDFYTKDVFKRKEPVTPIKDVRDRLKFLNIDDDIDYDEYFDKVIREPSEEVIKLDLYSRGTFQTSYLAGDFTVTSDLYKKDPQLNSIIDYYVNGQKVEYGERLLVFNQTFVFESVSKSLVGFGGTLGQSTVYNVTCPVGKRVVFDVSELEQLPTYQITTKTKGCNVTQANPTAF